MIQNSYVCLKVLSSVICTVFTAVARPKGLSAGLRVKSLACCAILSESLLQSVTYASCISSVLSTKTLGSLGTGAVSRCTESGTMGFWCLLEPSVILVKIEKKVKIEKGIRKDINAEMSGKE